MFPRAGFLRVVHILGRSQRHVKSRLGSGRRSLMRDSSPRTVPTTVDRGIRYSESWAEFYQRYFQIGGDLLRELYSFSLVRILFSPKSGFGFVRSVCLSWKNLLSKID